MILAENLSLCDDEDISPETFFSSHDVEMMKPLKIRPPGVYYFIGGTMAGKTTFLAKILLHRHNYYMPLLKIKMVNGNKTLHKTIFIILKDPRGNHDLSTL